MPTSGRPVIIPAHVTFDDLKLQIHDTGAVEFDREVLREVWTASGYDGNQLVSAKEDEIAAFIVRFFSAYVHSGGSVELESASFIVHLRDGMPQRDRHLPF